MPRPRSAAATRLTEAEIGVRVSLQFRIHDDPSYPFSEAVGVLQGIDHGTDDVVYRIVRRNGEVVEVKDDDIVKLKIIG